MSLLINITRDDYWSIRREVSTQRFYLVRPSSIDLRFHSRLYVTAAR